MKIKADFVTNSSTTSFVVWGVELEQSNVFKNERILELAFAEYEKRGYNEKGLTFNEFRQEMESGNFYELQELLNPIVSPLDMSTGPDGECFWIGASPFSIKDNQTAGEFKKEIIKKLNSIGIDVDQVFEIIEAWRDG